MGLADMEAALRAGWGKDVIREITAALNVSFDISG